jgi:hypothetical protein
MAAWRRAIAWRFGSDEVEIDSAIANGTGSRVERARIFSRYHVSRSASPPSIGALTADRS